MKFNDRTARANKHTAKSEAKFDKKPAATIVVKPRPEGGLLDILEEQPQGLYLVLDCVQDRLDATGCARSKCPLMLPVR